jgi:hypothetical protein
MNRGVKKGKTFRLYLKSDVVLYDSDFQEVRYDEVFDDGWVLYRLQGVWSDKIGAYVSRVYYMIKYSEEPFVRLVDKMVCISDQSFHITDNYKCINGRVVAKMVLWAMDKRFRDLWHLL